MVSTFQLTRSTELRLTHQKATKETKEEDRSRWGVETAWLAATVGLTNGT